MKRLHIVGSARSGTSLMLSMISNCFRNDGACSHEMRLFDEPDGEPELFISKLPADIKRIGLVLDKVPDLYVIYMERDPRSVIASRHRIDPEKYFCDFSVWRKSFLAAKSLRHNKRFLTIRYEDLTADPDMVQATIQSAFPFLEKLHPFSQYHKVAQPSFKAEEAMNGLRPVTPERVAGWKDHLPRLKAQLDLHPDLPSALIECGYEPDEKWLGLLADVKPDDTPSYYEDKEYTLIQRWKRGFRYRRKARKFIARHRNNSKNKKRG